MFKNLHHFLLELDLFIWTKIEKQQATELALEVEAHVRQLNGLTPATTAEANELLSILESTCLLSQRLIDRSKFNTNEVKPAPNKIRSDIPTESIAIPTKSELSSTIKEIIKLRDWVLLAKNTNTENSKVLSAIYQQLGQILIKEGVIEIEETGLFNCERHKVVATQITHNLEQDDYVCNTVRPGYLFNDELIRPQETIVYVFQTVND